MSKVNSPNLIGTYCTIISGNYAYIMMPLMSYGDLSSIISFHFSKGIHDEIAIATILKNCLEAIDCLNNNNWFHRDIKASNILLAEDGSVRLGDYGVSSVIKKEGNKTFVGSLCWMAPEIATNQEYTYKIDIWSLGITAIEIGNGKPPFYNLSPMEFREQIMNNKIPTLNDNNNCQWSQEFKNFINDCLIINPNKRPSAKQVLENNKNFFAKAKDKEYILKNILKGCPTLKEKFPKLLEGNEQLFKKEISFTGFLSKESRSSLDECNTDELGTDEKNEGRKGVIVNALNREVKKNENDLKGMFNDLNEEE